MATKCVFGDPAILGLEAIRGYIKTIQTEPSYTSMPIHCALWTVLSRYSTHRSDRRRAEHTSVRGEDRGRDSGVGDSILRST